MSADDTSRDAIGGLPGWAFWTLFAIAIPIHLVKRAIEGVQKLLRR